MVRPRRCSVDSSSEPLADAIAGPLIVSTFLFVAVLANFVMRGTCYCCYDFGLLIDPIVQCTSCECLCPCHPTLSQCVRSRQQKVPIPGLALLQQIMPIFVPSA